jgi:hypothetical protein
MGIAVDRRDDRLPEPRHGLRHVDEGAREIEPPRGGWARALVIPAETEHVAMSGHDASADLARLSCRFEPGGHFLRHDLADTVAVIGPLHSDDLDTSPALDLDLRCSHVSDPPRWPK